MPRYTPAQRRALSGDPAFPELAPEPQGPPYGPETRAMLSLAAQDARLRAAMAPDPPRRKPRPPKPRPSLAEGARAVLARMTAASAPASVLATVAEVMRCPRACVTNGCRDRVALDARAVAAWALRHGLGLSYGDSARFLGLSSHGSLPNLLGRIHRDAPARVARTYPRADLSAVRAGGLPLANVAAAYGVTVDDLLGTSRTARVAWPRQVAVWVLVERAGVPIRTAGPMLGRDHSTAWGAVVAVRAAAAGDESLRAELDRLAWAVLATEAA